MRKRHAPRAAPAAVRRRPALISTPLRQSGWAAFRFRVPCAASRGLGDLHLNLLEHYAPPSVVVNDHYEIVHLSDKAGRFLQFSAGEPSLNLMKVVQPELRVELRAGLFQASQTGRERDAQRRVPSRRAADADGR